MPRAARLAALLASVTLCAAAGAQSPEYVLEDDNTWREDRRPAAGSDEAIIAQARRSLADGFAGRTVALLNQWIELHDGEANRWLSTAYLLRADAKITLTHEYNALFDLEIIAKRFPASEEFPLALERELHIARLYSNGLKRRFAGMRIANAAREAEELFIRVSERMPGSVLAEQATIDLANHYYRRREMMSAAEMYQIYLELYPAGQNRVHAMRRLILANIARFKAPQYDTTSIIDAREQIRRFALQFPDETNDTEPIIERIDNALAERMLDNAKWYLKRRDAAGARLILERLVRKHPRSTAASEALQVMTRYGWAEAPSEEPPAQGSAR